MGTNDRKFTIAFAAAELSAPLELQITRGPGVSLPHNFALVGPMAAVSAVWQSGERAGQPVIALDPEAQPILEPGKGKPRPPVYRSWATVTLAIPAGQATEMLAIARLTPEGKKWEILPTKVDAARGVVMARTEFLGAFALIENRGYLPASVRSLTLPAGSVLVDDLDPGFQMFEVDGTVNYFWHTPCGPAGCWAGHAYWTYNRSDFEPLPLDQPWNWATWTPRFRQAGYYYVEVFVPAANATTTGADYEIYHNGQVEHVMVNQLANSGVWVSLGQFYFAADGTEYVYLDDVVPEQAQLASNIGYDAVLFTPTPLSSSQRYYLRNLGYKYYHCDAADPVSCSTGNIIFDFVDFKAPGKAGFDLVIERTYNGFDAFHADDPLNDREWAFGVGWSSFLDAKRRFSNDGSVDIRLGDGSGFFFVSDGAGGYVPGEDGVFHTLTEDGDEFVLTAPDQTSHRFDDLGRLIAMQDRRGNAITINRNDDGQATSIVDSGSRTFDVAYAGDFISSITDPLGRTVSYVHDDDGNLLAVTDGNGGVYHFLYSDRLLTQVTNPEGVLQARTIYDGDGRAGDQQDAAGNHTLFDFSTDGQTTVTDRENNSVVYHFDDLTRITKVVDAMGEDNNSVYDDDYNVVEFTDRNGNTWLYDHDDRGNVLSETDPLTNETAYTYNAENDLTSVVDAKGRLTQFEYENGNLVRIVRPDAVSILATFDGAGQMVTQTDANGNTTQFEYDAQGNLVREIDALGNVIAYEYDVMGRLTAVTDANNHRTEFVYDSNDNVVEIVDPRSNSTAFEYDLNDNLTLVVDRRGNATEYEYDDLQRLIRESSPEGRTFRYEYDNEGNRTRAIGPRDFATEFRYDANYRVIEVEDALDGITAFRYDANGNVTQETDALAFATAFEYDALDRLVKEIDALGGESITAYDEVGNVLFLTNARGAVTEFEYDVLDRRVLERDALGGEWLTDYDANGNVTGVTNANGNLTRYEYDAANRLVREIDGEGHVVLFGYDGVGNRTSVTDGRGFATTFAFDANDNLIANTDPLGGVATFEYDEEDTLVGQTDPSGHATRFEVDRDSLLTKVSDAENYETVYSYDAARNLTSLTNANGKTWTFTYDELDRRISQTDPLGGVAEYQYDALGQRIRTIDENGVATRFDYDALGRLVTEVRNEQPGQPANQETNVTFRYAYDPAGNRISEIDANGNPTTNVYDLLDRLLQKTDAENQVTSYAYDAVGNLTQLTNPRGFSTAFGYNADDLLISVNDALSQMWQFAYDAAHNRTDAIDPHGVVTHNQFDGLNRRTAEIRNYKLGQPADSETNVTVGYSYYPDSLQASTTDPNGNPTLYRYDRIHRLVEQEDALGGVTRTSYDGVGNRLAIADANGHVTTYTYDALNRMLTETDPAGHQTRQAYDAVGNLVRVTNGRGFSTDVVYDPLYRPVTVVDALGGQVRQGYDAMGNVLTLTDQNSHSQHFTYDLVYQTLSHTDAEGYVTAFEYDANGNRTAIVDGNSHRTAFGYDALDRMESTTNAENETTRFAYDALGNRTELTEADGVVTRFTYDPLYRLAGVTLNYVLIAQPDYQTNVFYDYGYDANGNQLAIADPLQHVTGFAYDELNRLVREVNPLNNTWQYGYDPVGNQLTRRDANGALTSYSYYADDLLRQISYPSGAPVLFEYDANHNRTRMADGLGVTTWTYDALDRLTATTDSLSRSLAYAYDPVGNRTGITYPDQRAVAYSYFDNDWLRTVTDPQGGVTSYQRDGVGQPTLITNPNATVAEMSYDRANRLLSLVNRQISGAQKTISSFRYTLDDVGQRVRMDAEYGWRNPPRVSTTYQYDPLRRLVRTDDSEGVWTTYAFDAAGNRLQLSTNDDAFSPRPFDAQTQSYTYDDANELLSVLSDTRYSSGQGQSRPQKVAQALQAFRHEVAAQRGKHITAAAADSLLAAVDSLIGQLYSNRPPTAAATASAIASLRTQVAAYRQTGAIDSDGIANSLRAKLDKADRANSGGAGGPGDLQTTTYRYDANGNRVNEHFPGPQGPQVQGTDYAYDFENRMVQALAYQGNNQGNRVDRSVTTMAYDGTGRRLVKTYDPKTGASGIKRTEYVFDGLDPVAEYSMWNGQRSNFYRGDQNRLLTMHTFPSGQRYWYHYDGLGSVTGLTKDQGQSVHNYRYDVYGTVVPVNGNWTEPHNHYTFTGQEWVDELALLHFYARDYDPSTGVWMQQDPYRGRLVEPVTLHRYGYVYDNPINYFDHYGYNRESRPFTTLNHSPLESRSSAENALTGTNQCGVNYCPVPSTALNVSLLRGSSSHPPMCSTSRGYSIAQLPAWLRSLIGNTVIGNTVEETSIAGIEEAIERAANRLIRQGTYFDVQIFYKQVAKIVTSDRSLRFLTTEELEIVLIKRLTAMGVIGGSIKKSVPVIGTGYSLVKSASEELKSADPWNYRAGRFLMTVGYESVTFPLDLGLQVSIPMNVAFDTAKPKVFDWLAGTESGDRTALAGSYILGGPVLYTAVAANRYRLARSETSFTRDQALRAAFLGVWPK